MDIKNITFNQGDVGKLPYEDETMETLRSRFNDMHSSATVTNVKSIAVFQCI